MRAAVLILFALPAMADAPLWKASPICEHGRLVGVIVAAPAKGAVSLRFDASQICYGRGKTA